MSPYIYFEEEGESFILQRAFPHFVGKITSSMPNKLASFPIAGYYMYVTIVGTIRGNVFPSYNQPQSELNDIASEMAGFSLKYIIEKEDKYKQYKYVKSPDEQPYS